MKTLLRAAVMLTALVGLPALWIVCGPLPPAVQRTVDGVVAKVKQRLDWDHIDWGHVNLQELMRRVVKPSAPPASTAQHAVPQAIAKSPTTSAPRFPITAAVAATPTPAATPSLTQQLDPLLVQLRAFGAAEYSLQRWGPDAVMYRFHCDMPLAAGAQLTEQFEAIASTPQAAVQQVLHEVAAWSANRQALAASKRLASR